MNKIEELKASLARGDSLHITGKLLQEVREENLYKTTHKRFDTFCKEVLKISVSYANYLAKAYTTAQEMKVAFSENKLPQNEFSLRILAKYPIENRVFLWQEVLKEKEIFKHLEELPLLKKVVTKYYPDDKNPDLTMQNTKLIEINKVVASLREVATITSDYPNLLRRITTVIEEFRTKEGDTIIPEKSEINQPRLSVFDCLEKSPSELTASQKQALDKLLDFIKGKDKYFKLKGYAGTGKSFLVVRLIKELLKEKNLSIICASPTNKAAKNLAKLAEENKLEGIETITLAKLLGLFPEINSEKGIEEFIMMDRNSIDYNLILIDEYSMVSGENLKNIHEKSSAKAKVIFIGDAAQLPPIGESDPPVEKFNLIKSEAELKEIVRYDGELLRISEKIRSDAVYNRKLYPFTSTKDNSVTCLNFKEWTKKGCEIIKSKGFQDNPNICRFLVWRNKTAESINNTVREYLWGETLLPFEIGDLLIAKTPVFRECYNPVKKRNEWGIVVNNSEECTVISPAVLMSKSLNVIGFKSNFEYWEVPTISESNHKIKLRILTPESEITLKTIQEQVKAKILAIKGNKKGAWYEYQTLAKTFDNTPFAYAITTHKAQGSSIDNVFLATYDLKGCPDLQKIQYTAVTRTKSKLWIPQ